MNLSANENEKRIETLFGKHNMITTESCLDQVLIDEVLDGMKNGDGTAHGAEALSKAAGLVREKGLEQDVKEVARDFSLVGDDLLLDNSYVAGLYAFYPLLYARLDGDEAMEEEAAKQGAGFYRELDSKRKDRKEKTRLFSFEAKTFDEEAVSCAKTEAGRAEVLKMADALKKGLSDEKGLKSMDGKAFADKVQSILLEAVVNSSEDYPEFSREAGLAECFTEKALELRNLLEAEIERRD